MSQQRECCCSGVFEPECLHADKIFVHTEDEWTSSDISRREKDYWDIAPLAQRDGFGYDQRVFQTLYRRKNAPSLYYETHGDNIKDQSATTGMSCMLCNKVLMLNFRRPSFDFSQYQEAVCPTNQAPECCGPDGVFNERFPGDYEKTQSGGAGSCARHFITYYDWSDVQGSGSEEPFNQMYLHWKDYWYMDFTPKGVPFTKRNELWSGCKYNPNSCFTRLGVGSYYINSNIGKCGGDPVPTDGNYMCHPELARVTNPTNHFYYSRNNAEGVLKPVGPLSFKNRGTGYDPDGNVPATTGIPQALASAALLHDPDLVEEFTDIGDPVEAELMHLYSGLVSNVNWVVGHLPSDYGGFGKPGSDRGSVGDLEPEGAALGPTPRSAFVPGMSSWQCYTMQKSPNLRVLSDISTYLTPTDKYNYTGSQDELFRGNVFPTISFPEYDPTDPNPLPELGTPCNATGTDRQYNNLYSTTVGTLYRVRLWCNSRAVTITEPINPPVDNPCGDADGTCTDASGGQSCKDKSNDYWDCHCDGEVCKGYAKPLFPCNYGIDAYSEYNRTRGYLGVDPPLSNNRLLFDKPSGPFGAPDDWTNDDPPGGPEGVPDVNAGYHDFVRQNTGPWGIMYFCSGTPIFLHDLCALEESTQDGPVVWNEADTNILLQAFAGRIKDYTLPQAPNEGEDGGGGSQEGGSSTFRRTEAVDRDPISTRDTGSYFTENGSTTFLDENELPFAKSIEVNGIDTSCINDIIGNVLGPAVEKLGNLGVSKIKDFRDEQAAKLRTIESEFKRIAEENREDMEEETYDYLSTFAFGQEIYDHIKDTELLPVQKTYRWLNLNLINYGRGKDKVFNEYSEDTNQFLDWNMSGDMQDHQISPVEGFETDRFGDTVKDLRINRYDPWIQGKLVHMQNRGPFRMPLDNGPEGNDQRVFNWLYPVEELVDTGEGLASNKTYGQFRGNSTAGEGSNSLLGDGSEVPVWEKELYDVWWPNMPVYFHASPGGWNWSGTGGWGQPWRCVTQCPENPEDSNDQPRSTQNQFWYGPQTVLQRRVCKSIYTRRDGKPKYSR
jgi:hypothetical protein